MSTQNSVSHHTHDPWMPYIVTLKMWEAMVWTYWKLSISRHYFSSSLSHCDIWAYTVYTIITENKNIHHINGVFADCIISDVSLVTYAVKTWFSW